MDIKKLSTQLRLESASFVRMVAIVLFIKELFALSPLAHLAQEIGLHNHVRRREVMNRRVSKR